MEEEALLASAALLNLDIPKEQIPSVKAHFDRIEAIAKGLEAVELDPFTDEMAPVWKP